jgi:site-specific DNA-methyltransferase (adenine-specific)
MHGDCLELMKSIPDNSIDMVLTDPPYGTTKCKWDVVIDFDLMWNELKRITKDNGAICLFGSEPFSSLLRVSNIKQFKYDWIWDKVKPNGHLVAKKRPMQRNEIISVFSNGKINYYPQMIDRQKPKKSKEYKRTEIMGGVKTGSSKILKQKYPQNIVVFSNASQRNKLHPTQKPVALLEYLIKTYTLENETVLDFTMGSGSTGVACKNLNRSFIGIEQDDKYFEIAKNRINADI